MLNKALAKGIQLEKKYLIECKNGEINIKKEENEKISYDKLMEKLNIEIEKIIESTKNGYEKSFIFTFLYGRKITMFLNYINLDIMKVDNETLNERRRN